jgi:hypothetical protein
MGYHMLSALMLLSLQMMIMSDQVVVMDGTATNLDDYRTSNLFKHHTAIAYVT